MTINNETIKTQKQDWLLRILVSMVNAESIQSMGITLTVGGQIISGDLIGHRAYFKEFGSQWSKMMADSDSRNEVTSAWQKLGEQLFETSKSDSNREESSLASQQPQYLHLRNAYFLTPGGPMPSKPVMLWRGKISSVDGFTLGSMGYEPSNQAL